MNHTSIKYWRIPYRSTEILFSFYINYKGKGAASNNLNHGQNIWDKLLFLCEIVHYEKSLNSIFQDFFASIDKILILGGRLGLVRQLVYIIFNTNNHASFHLHHASFHLPWKKNLVKHQNVSKYYDHDCRSNSLDKTKELLNSKFSKLRTGLTLPGEKLDKVTKNTHLKLNTVEITPQGS